MLLQLTYLPGYMCWGLPTFEALYFPVSTQPISYSNLTLLVCDPPTSIVSSSISHAPDWRSHDWLIDTLPPKELTSIQM